MIKVSDKFSDKPYDSERGKSGERKITKVVPDTSIIIDKKLSALLEQEKLKDIEIIVPIAVLDELQSQASHGREIGFIGLEELKNLRQIAEKKGLKMRFTGKRPSMEDIQLAKSGRLDAIIRDVARTEDAELLTADYVQALVGDAEGVKVRHLPAEIKTEDLRFESYFTKDTISVHLKEGVVPLAKRGKPGEFKLVQVGHDLLTKEQVESIIHEIDDATHVSEDGQIEINRRGAMVIQLGDYRIAIARPPFSDGLEVTIVRPIIKMRLEDYNLSEKLMSRIAQNAEGIIIAGPPGSGKSTLAAGLAEFYSKQGKIVKTLESPRDLQVGPEITQYAPLEGDYEKTADILLLVRPDYSVFDEVRKQKDFNVFADLRLAGIGLVGVIHASKAIDSIQRFMGKIDLGMIPHVIDTIIFVEAGIVSKVYDVKMTVKVPTGMTEADLARPIVEVRDFETGKPEYEIYTYGEENIVVPIGDVDQNVGAQGAKAKPAAGVNRLATEQILREMRKFDPDAEVQITGTDRAKVLVDNSVVARVIGKKGENVNKLQERLGLHLDIEPRIATATGKEFKYQYRERGKKMEFFFDRKLIGKEMSMYIEDKFLFSAIVGKKSKITLTKNSDWGKELVTAMIGGRKIKAMG